VRTVRRQLEIHRCSPARRRLADVECPPLHDMRQYRDRVGHLGRPDRCTAFIFDATLHTLSNMTPSHGQRRERSFELTLIAFRKRPLGAGPIRPIRKLRLGSQRWMDRTTIGGEGARPIGVACLGSFDAERHDRRACARGHAPTPPLRCRRGRDGRGSVRLVLVAACTLVDADRRVLLAERPAGRPMPGAGKSTCDGAGRAS
jgi:hypothetical protein